MDLTPYRGKNAGVLMRAFLLGPWLLSLWLLTAGPALADNNADEADIAFELGNDAYSHGNYTEALRSYFTSYRLVPNRNVLFNIARCFEALGKFNEAYRYYNDLLGEDLPAEDASEVTRSLERLRPKVALVRVTTNPRGAEVFVDRADLGSRGRSPQTLALSPGRHKVLVQKSGYRPTEATVTLVRGREVPVDLDLGLITGMVDITGSPEGAEVRDNPTGPVLGRIPAKLLKKPVAPFTAPKPTHWVRFTDGAWLLASACRRYRGLKVGAYAAEVFAEVDARKAEHERAKRGA